MKLYIIVWSHKYGVDAIPILIPPGMNPPELTNEFMQSVGLDADLSEERGLEWASWTGPFDVDDLPILKRKGPIEWEPEGEPEGD